MSFYKFTQLEYHQLTYLTQIICQADLAGPVREWSISVLTQNATKCSSNGEYKTMIKHGALKDMDVSDWYYLGI